jgi:hypothetical protein
MPPITAPVSAPIAHVTEIRASTVLGLAPRRPTTVADISPTR